MVGRNRRLICALVVVCLAANGAAITSASAADGSKSIAIKVDADRRHAPLSGATVTGIAYLSLQNPAGITQVSYYLDDPKQTKAAGAVSAVPPFRVGVKTTNLPQGRHSITAVATTRSGQKRVNTVFFNVGKSSSGGSTTAPTAGQFLPVAASGKKWALSFSEEFNGANYDPKKLTPCFDWNYGDCTKTFNTGREVYKPSQVQVSNGTAKLVAEPMSPAVMEEGCYQGKCDYKSGLLSTARPNASDGSDYLYKFTYGYVESRMKISSTSGFFTAFWMLPADPSFSYDYEIDILEQLGFDPSTMFMTYHYGGRSESHALNKGERNNGACPVKDYSTGFHNFGLDWQPTHIAWYIDGIKCGEFTDAKNIVNVPMQLIIDMMVDNQWERDWKKTTLSPTAKSQLEVDYLRVYQQK